MKSRLTLLFVLTGCLLFDTVRAAQARAPQLAESVFNFALVADQRELRLDYKGLPMLVYVFGTNQFKPYVRELYAFNGVNVLQDAPPGHLHHHGLMYAIKVNGTNFWEETPVAGYERPGQELRRTVGRDKSGRPKAEFTQAIYWVTPDHANLPNPAPVALVVEQRTIRVTADESNGEVALEWRGDFAVGPAASKVTLGGAAYHGLGLRFPESFDKVALHQNSEGLPYTAEQKWDVTPAKWASVSGTVAGRNLMVALFSDPANRNPPKYFSMINDFAYLSATQGLDTTPIEYSAGDKFSLRYLLTVYPTPKSKEFLAARFARWTAE